MSNGSEAGIGGNGNINNLINYADEAYIIRSEQKDNYHLYKLVNLFEPIIRKFFGSRFFDSNYGYIEVCLLTLYTALTSGKGKRTLGEEYTNIRKYSNGSSINSRAFKLLLILSIPTPHILKYILNKHYNKVINATQNLFLKSMLMNFVKITTSTKTWDLLRTINLIKFYLGGKFYTLKHRLFNLSYISLDDDQQSINKLDKPFEILGYLLIFRLLIQVLSFIKPHLLTSHTTSSSADVKIDGNTINLDESDENHNNYSYLNEQEMSKLNDERQRKCILCLEDRVSTSAMNCGHLYCWDCVESWLKEKAECPLCRQPTSLNNIWPVYNL